jgi:hypothetical protein
LAMSVSSGNIVVANVEINGGVCDPSSLPLQLKQLTI